MAATALWKSKRAGEWAAAWTRYPAVVASLQKEKLVELDEWFQTALPDVLHKRDPEPFLTQKELVRLMEWKLKKGKWRPQLMKYVESLSAAEVRSASAKALSELESGTLKSAVEALAALKGVGPATASAVLAAYDNNAPFMGDEALEAIAHIIGARKYTLGHYLLFATQMQEKAKWLNAKDAKPKDAGGSEEDAASGDDKWTAQKVQLCLYAAAHTSAPAPAIMAEPKTAAKAKARAKAPAPASSREAEETQPTRKRRRTVVPL